MKEANVKTAAKHKENVNQSKSQLKEINAEAREKRSEIKLEFGEGAKASKENMKKNSTNKNIMLVWGLILSIPLAIIALVLFVMLGLLVWDIFIGL